MSKLALFTALATLASASWYTPDMTPQGAYFHFYDLSIWYDLETPIQVYVTLKWDQMMWNSVAAMSANYLDAHTEAPPLIRAPAGYHTARHRLACSFYALYEVLPKLFPGSVERHAQEMIDFGFANYTSPQLRSDVAACLDGANPAPCLQSKLDVVLLAGGDDRAVAAVLGAMVGHLHARVMASDGMNADGMMGENGRKCTRNCWYFKDYTNYAPVNGPKRLVDETRWQPLIEGDMIGFYYAQEHVSPQVGQLKAQAVPQSFFSRTTKAPNYDYGKLDMDPVNEVAKLAGDDEKKMLVEYLDVKYKLLSDIGAKIGTWSEWSMEQMASFIMGFIAAEMDAVSITWREKIKHDAIRPTSRVQKATSFNGTNTMPWYDGKPIDKEDWTPYIRVMPHAEYPSGSASICWSIAGYVDAWIQDTNTLGVKCKAGACGATSVSYSKTFAMGSSKTEPESVPAADITHTFTDMDDVAMKCSESRLWGGMHYRPAIDASKELVKGFGEAAYNFTQRLLNGDPLPGILPEDMPTSPTMMPTTPAVVNCADVKKLHNTKTQPGKIAAQQMCDALKECQSAVDKKGRFQCNAKRAKTQCKGLDEATCKKNSKCAAQMDRNKKFKKCGSAPKAKKGGRRRML